MTEFSGDAGQVAQQLDRETIVWAYRLLLDRDPESEEVISAMQTAWGTTRDLRRAIMASQEFRGKNAGDLAYTPESTVVIAELRDSLRLFVDLSDIAIGLNIARGRYEESELAYVRRAIKPGQTVLDIGANVGFFSIAMGALVGPEGHVYAFEPVTRNADLLERSIRENGMEERITLKRVVVGHEEGQGHLVELDLAAGALNSGGAYLQPLGTAVPVGHDIRAVSMVTLNHQNLRSPVSFIKVDVEGAEPLVFRGASAMLDADRPVILSEINPPQLGKVSGCTPGEFIAEMKALGYGCFALENGRPSRSVTLWTDSSIRSVVFLPQDRAVESLADPDSTSENAEFRSPLSEISKRERQLRETRRPQEALARAGRVEQELRREIEHYASYHNAVEHSRVWRGLQFLRGLFGRRW